MIFVKELEIGCLVNLAPSPRPSYPAPGAQPAGPSPHKILTPLNWM